MKTVVIYHKADFDGIFCREIAKKFLPDAILIGWDYGDPVEDIRNGLTTGDQLYMLDISVEGLMDWPGLIWIDHHKSAMAKFDERFSGGKPIAGYRIDGVAACRLAWQFFNSHPYTMQEPNGELTMVVSKLPSKEEFIDHIVTEPFAVRLAGEYDIWDKRDPDAEIFQYGLRSRDLSHDWGSLLSIDRKMTVSEIEALIDVGHNDLLRPDGTNPNPTVLGLIDSGYTLQYAKAKENESIIKRSGFDVTFQGLNFLACNHAMFNSFLFTAGIKPEHDALLGFAWDGSRWRVSLYHAPGKEHHDLSLIAVSFGGGGHKGACGFVLNQVEPPFKK